MLGGLYAALAIAGWLAFCALIAWFVGRFVDYAAQLFDDEDGKVADAHGDCPLIPTEMRAGGRNLLSKPGGSRLDRAGDRPSRTTLTHAFTRPSSGTEAL
jgi:hypothetical protein